MGYSIDVSEENFESVVIEQSYKKPVIVDFWAPWCGPCQMLKPILEKLAEEFDLILAKVNTDENVNIANKFNVSGIPDVRIIIEGKEVEKFVGALPENKIREIISKYIKSEIDKLLEEAYMEYMAGNLKEAEEIFKKLLKEYPENRKILLEAGKFFIKEGKEEEAVNLLQKIKEYETDYYPKAKALIELVSFKKWCENLKGETELEKLIKEGACSAVREDYKTALEKFLEVVKKDKKFMDEIGRKSMVAIFNILGESDPLTKEYRKKLAMWLY